MNGKCEGVKVNMSEKIGKFQKMQSPFQHYEFWGWRSHEGKITSFEKIIEIFQKIQSPFQDYKLQT